jgi:hypothetical protein
MVVEANQSLKLTEKTLAHFHGSLPQPLAWRTNEKNDLACFDVWFGSLSSY